MSSNAYGFDQDAALLKNSARKFFSEKLPVDKLHELVAQDPTLGREPQSIWSEELWQEIIDLKLYYFLPLLLWIEARLTLQKKMVL